MNDINQIEEERKGRLNQARLTAEVLGGMMSLNASKVADKLGEMIAKYDKEAFVIILALALIKDGALDILLDFVGIGLIPFVGQIPGTFLSTALFLLMWRKGMLKGKIMARVLFLFVGDNIPILEEFPFTTFAVLFAWRGMVKKTRQAQADKEALARATNDELEEIKKRYEMESEE